VTALPRIPDRARTPRAGRSRRAPELRAGLTDAGPVAIAGLLVNGASALVVVVVARLVSPREYGAVNQLLGLFFVLSMPGSAVVVGVVRRVTAWRMSGQLHLVTQWVRRVHRLLGALVILGAAVVAVAQSWIARQLGLPSDAGVLTVLVAGGLWIVLCVDRGLLQSDRAYRPLAGNLLLEGAGRTAAVLVLVLAGLGVGGYGLGVLLGEIGAVAEARWLVRRRHLATADEQRPDGSGPGDVPGAAAASQAPVLVTPTGRRQLLGDVAAAFVALGLLALLQNADVIMVGRYDRAAAGPYAAISVASKALVFAALALGSYLLPEATIRWHAGGHAVRQLGVALLLAELPAVVLLCLAVAVPKVLLRVVFSARLTAAAPAFATLAAAMAFLCVSVLLTNYLIGTGTRWIVGVLGGGGLAVLGAVVAARGRPLATARADLAVQAAVCVALGLSFLLVHHRRHGDRWRARFGTAYPWAPGFLVRTALGRTGPATEVSSTATLAGGRPGPATRDGGP
jgi:O-antigen/teichoic acid export membrane protein